MKTARIILTFAIINIFFALFMQLAPESDILTVAGMFMGINLVILLILTIVLIENKLKKKYQN